MLRTLVGCSVAALALSACEPVAEITREPVVAFAAASVNGAPRVGAQSIVIRTYVEQDGAEIEVTGVPCTLRSREVSASVVTPQEVRLSQYAQGARFPNRGAPSDLTIRCSGSGKSATILMEPTPAVNAPQTDTGFADPSQGQVQIMTTTLSGQMSSAVPWGYPSPGKIVLK